MTGTLFGPGNRVRVSTSPQGTTVRHRTGFHNGPDWRGRKGILSRSFPEERPSGLGSALRSLAYAPQGTVATIVPSKTPPGAALWCPEPLVGRTDRTWAVTIPGRHGRRGRWLRLR